ncbi:hypothetical protein AC1031_014197 [Aphanomyces cochlioides]|nr:hypothetical protein AC1031_014197 [Aphanomyces cochlioides]
MIKESNTNSLKCDAKELQLYLALKDNAWLESTSPLVERLMKGETPDEIQEYLVEANKMNPFSTLAKALTSPPGQDQLHILVVVPERQGDSQPNKKQRQDGRVFFSLKGIQAVDPGSCEKNVWIDTQEIMKVTDFPADYFVRKESIDVFNILKARTNQIVLVGSPGVGKSLLLVLYSFWMAIEGKKCVLLVRYVKGKGLSMIFLNGQNLLDNWKLEGMNDYEIAQKVQQCIRSFPNCELCLDGFLQSFLKKHLGVLMQFSVLATSAQYETKQDDAGVLDLCLVPFWSLSDLKLVGKHHTWDDESMEKKYYFSGGSLRLFLLSEMGAEIAAEEAFRNVDIASAELLNTQYGTNSDKQIDQIRMATLLDTSDLKNYHHPGKWSYVICSGFALRKLGERVTLEYYKDLCHKAYMINDFGLFGIAFENCFHAMAREKKSIQLKVREYDSTKAHEYSVVTFTSDKHLLKGRDQAEFENVMEAWPSDLDYWYPESRSLKTIDSIAKIGGEYLLLQLTRSKTHSIDTEYLQTIADCFPPNSSIAYIAVVPNKAICDEFRLRPANPVTPIPLRVAYVDDDFFNKFGNYME